MDEGEGDSPVELELRSLSQSSPEWHKINNFQKKRHFGHGDWWELPYERGGTHYKQKITHCTIQAACKFMVVAFNFLFNQGATFIPKLNNLTFRDFENEERGIWFSPIDLYFYFSFLLITSY